MWIKMRTNLATDGRVVRTARLCGVSIEHAIGALFRLWAIADEQTTNGCLAGYSPDDIDAQTKTPGLFAALSSKEIDWISSDEDGVYITRFGDHNGKTAKNRAISAKRASRFRNAGSVTKSARKAHLQQNRTDESRTQNSRGREDTVIAPAVEADSSASQVLPLLLSIKAGGVRPLFDATAAAAIAGHPKCSRPKVLWAVETLIHKQRSQNKATNPAGYLRGLIENKDPPDGWMQEYQRKELAKMANPASVDDLRIAQ